MLARIEGRDVGCATGEAKEPPLRPVFDRRIKLEFHGARITSDGGLLACPSFSSWNAISLISSVADVAPGQRRRFPRDS